MTLILADPWVNDRAITQTVTHTRSSTKGRGWAGVPASGDHPCGPHPNPSLLKPCGHVYSFNILFTTDFMALILLFTNVALNAIILTPEFSEPFNFSTPDKTLCPLTLVLAWTNDYQNVVPDITFEPPQRGQVAPKSSVTSRSSRPLAVSDPRQFTTCFHPGFITSNGYLNRHFNNLSRHVNNSLSIRSLVRGKVGKQNRMHIS